MSRENAKKLRESLGGYLDSPLPDLPDIEFKLHFGETVLTREERKGMTFGDYINGRLVAKAAIGDMAALTQLLDRYAGKPTQVNENINHNVDYTEWLDQQAELGMEEPELLTYDDPTSPPKSPPSLFE